jgi:hypothetical protein
VWIAATSGLHATDLFSRNGFIAAAADGLLKRKRRGPLRARAECFYHAAVPALDR